MSPTIANHKEFSPDSLTERFRAPASPAITFIKYHAERIIIEQLQSQVPNQLQKRTALCHTCSNLACNLIRMAV